MEYAREYLEHLLDTEDVVGRDFYQRLDKILDEKLDEKVLQYMKEKEKERDKDGNHKP